MIAWMCPFRFMKNEDAHCVKEECLAFRWIPPIEIRDKYYDIGICYALGSKEIIREEVE